MIVLKILAVIIVIEAVAIMALGIIRGIRDLRYGHKEPEIVEPEGEPYTIDLSGLQPWDTEHISSFYIKSKEAEKNDRETKADN